MKNVAIILMFFALSSCSQAPEASVIKMGKAEYAPHGPMSFSVTTVVLRNDTIIKSDIEEYSYFTGEGTVSVPNADAFKNATGAVLGTKKANSVPYSQIMKNRGSTQEIAISFKAIEDFTVGKTIGDLNTFLAGKEDSAVVDGVSGATLVSTPNYLKSIILAAENAVVIGQ